MKSIFNKYKQLFISIIVIIPLIIGITIFRYLRTRDLLFAFVDGFTVAGVLFILFGLLVYVSNNGVFYGFTYLASGVIRMFKADRAISFYDYKMSREEIKRGSFLSVALVGAISLAIGILIYLIF